MQFLDDEETLPPLSEDPADPEPRLAGDERRRQFMVRRLIAVAGGVLILVLLVFGVRGCLDARKARSFENYQSDVTSIAEESSQLGESFFSQLNDPTQESDLSLEAQVNADKGTAEALVSRIEALDPPGELASAQRDFVFSLELRRDGLAVIATEIPRAAGDETSEPAIAEIDRQMRVFLASDVLYERGRESANAVFHEEGVGGDLPASVFLDDQQDWLDPTTVDLAISGASGASADVTGVHGLGLVEAGTTVNGVPVTPGVQTSIPANGEIEVSAQIQNQGEGEESDIDVTASVAGQTGKKQISSIAPAETVTVTIPINASPPPGQVQTLEVTAATVPGEQVSDNNTAEYTIVFE